MLTWTQPQSFWPGRSESWCSPGPARAVAAAQTCDLVLAVGSTLSVHPAASIPLIAHHCGTPYVILNQGPTDHDSLPTVRLDGDATTLLPQLIARYP
ncbi:MAG: hypothetical protein ACYCW6_29275 [Candidatus Xenobia bacterium]